MSKIKCTHCHLEFDQEVMIQDNSDENLFFCCKGCQGIYHLLKSEGLDSFYDKLGKNTLTPANEIETPSDLEKFDLESFEKEYVKVTPEGFKRIDLIIEGIHCAACVWLNEKVLYNLDGIVEAHINFTNNKAKVVWDDDTLKLSKIIETVRAIGYNAYPYTRSLSEEKAKKEKKDYFTKLFVAVFGMMNIMMLAIGKYTGYFTGLEEDARILIHFGEFVLATPVLLYSGSIFYKNAYYGLKNRFINMDFLVITGATLVYFYSIYAIFTPGAHTYFDSAVMIITFVMLGKYLEIFSKKSVMDSIDSIKNQIPTEVTVVEEGSKKVISPSEVKVGDIIELKAGEKSVIDGVVTSGKANFDESGISGESRYVPKTAGADIISGTVNIDGVIRYQAKKDYSQSLLSNIINLLEDSIHSKPKIEQLANQISGKFSLTILGIALLSFIGWYGSGESFEHAFIIAISVIVIACPCALALATPVASILGIGKLAKNHILFKEARYIETLAQADTIVFDKTGTITKGKLEVSKFTLKKEFEIGKLYSLVSLSRHPVSQGIKNYLEQEYTDLKSFELENFEHLDAKGIKATLNGEELIGGNMLLLKDHGIQTEVVSRDSLFFFADGKEILAEIHLRDLIKEDAVESIRAIQKLGLDTIMLTGDHENVAKKVAREVGIEHYYAEQNPIQKADFIKSLKDKNKTVIMVGDGINDTVALAKSDIAVSIKGGADMAIDISDVVILTHTLNGLKESIKISKITFKFIKQNLAISLIYNLITIPLAVMGYVIPFVAALSMSVSSLLVVGNSLRIKNSK